MLTGDDHHGGVGGAQGGVAEGVQAVACGRMGGRRGWAQRRTRPRRRACARKSCTLGATAWHGHRKATGCMHDMQRRPPGGGPRPPGWRLGASRRGCRAARCRLRTLAAVCPCHALKHQAVIIDKRHQGDGHLSVARQTANERHMYISTFACRLPDALARGSPPALGRAEQAQHAGRGGCHRPCGHHQRCPC